MPRYSPVSSRADFAASEVEVLAFWRQEKIFARSLEQHRDAPPYVFYEGPPTANAKPGIHHVLSRSFKDLFPRYRQMCGYSVARKGGWDTHGLPVELEVEKALKISGKRQIEEYGVARFNQLCRESVNTYIDVWERVTERMGFWLDIEHPYRTDDGRYIESVWWSLKYLWEREMLYQGYKVLPYCPRCQTSLSSAELALGYREGTVDPSVYVKFKLVDSDASLLAWTTTPWTLPGNVAVAVHPHQPYVRVRHQDEDLILARARLHVLDGEYTIEEEMQGSDLVGLSYLPLFSDMPPEGTAFIVLDAADMVSMDDGTGIVHTAAAYGEADLRLCQERGVAVRHVVGLDGRFLEGQTRYAGMFVKDADPQIIEDLRSEGRLYRAETIEHSYPFCWRCETPLLYYALTSWFIRTTARKQQLIDNNRTVAWQPSHIRDGRMGNWLENLVDWNLSRTRYWGTPLPIWICEGCDRRRCIGSAEEVGLSVDDDLHRPYIDEVVLTCEHCGAAMRRVPEVIDCWYDSGAMPFAQWHHPFENADLLDARHPADFVCEGMDQTRGWFYSLMACSTLLFDLPAYRHVICTGLVVDERGRKYSKSRGITVDPMAIFDEHGADATRWYFYSAVAAGNEYRFSAAQVREVARRFMLTLWNTYSFFISYASLDDFDPGAPVPAIADRPAIDRWCLARLAQTVQVTRDSLDAYDAVTACRAIEHFVEDVSKWYVRRSRARFWRPDGTGEAGDAAALDKAAAYATLHTTLHTLAVLLAPFMPFLAERLYRNLSGLDADGGAAANVPISAHLVAYPTALDEMADFELLTQMSRLRALVEAGKSARETARIKGRQPLAAATIHGEVLPPELEQLFIDELNVRAIRYAEPDGEHDAVSLDTEITDELRLEGLVRELSRKVNELRKQAGLQLDDRIVLSVDAGGELSRAVAAHRTHLMAETLATEVRSGRHPALASFEGSLGGEQCWLGVGR